MKNWPSKDPNEVKDYVIDWSAELHGDSILSSVFTLHESGGVVIDSQSNTVNSATIWLSGGDAGSIVVILNTINTSGGRTLKQAVTLMVESSIPAPSSGYVKPSPAYIKLRYRDFADVPDAVIQAYIDDCPVDESWLESDYTRAIALWVCHQLSINGIGGDDVAEMSASGVKSFSSGKLSVSFAGDSASGGDIGGWDSSKYGKQFYVLMRQNVGGPRVVSGGACGGVSGWAKDVPSMIRPW